MHVAAPSELPSTSRNEAAEAGRLFEHHSERLLAYCTRFLGSRADAEDAVQTTFLYAQRALERGVVPEAEYAWLHAIAKNVCRWQQRTLARRGGLSSDIDLDTLPSSRLADEGDVADLRPALEDALASLPESQRRALLLREWEGLASHEVAARLGMSTTATYALLTRARRSLGRALTATTRKPLLGLDFVGLFLRLKGLLAGGTAKVLATTVVAASVAVGGTAVGRAVVDGAKPPAPARAPSRTGATVVEEAPSVVRPSPDGASARVTKAPGTVVDRAGPERADTGPGATASAPAAGDSAVAPNPGSAPDLQSPSPDADQLPAELPKLPPEAPPLPDDELDPLLDDLLPVPVPEVEPPPLPVDVPPPTVPVDVPEPPRVELDPPAVDAPLPEAPPLPPLPDVELPLP